MTRAEKGERNTAGIVQLLTSFNIQNQQLQQPSESPFKTCSIKQQYQDTPIHII